ncbi:MULTISPECIES: arylsulfatase [unclassified Imperialibacter]|uniref:arylsulfatase n=1 Tax=unclassified Imperialibacter TaxID=2629706 RepID=UPI00125983A0|nr:MULTISPECIES: arylsulfatase [unclassified Imperialibacter]CAD5264933.1 Arylsulfatase A [Imperialibacter sp. 89]CAD5269800.1 Arylsulfatase A [Imperialibacter sp. 75]VVT09419.1 Arylsulfatase A [Imperialibacter sp. EC-SDR9]
MRNLLLSFIAASFIGCLSGCEEPAPKRPNILLVLTDDQGWGDLAFHGNDSIDTPHLDWLAQHATEFTRFYVSPVCAPTRASILTGRYHLATGTSWVTHRMEVMREEEVTIAEVMKAAGYRTGLFGKWHNGKQYPHDPVGQGFQEFFGFKEGHFNNYFDATLTHNFEEVKTQGYMANVLADKAMEFMAKEGPFLCMLTLNTPHGPFQVPDEYFDKYAAMGFNNKDAAVYGMVENIDDIIGRLLDHINAIQKEEETIVIFMTDNGPNGVRYNGGYKGIKAHVDEGGVRVPFLIRYPRLGWDKGKKIEKMAAHIDMLPTLAELTGIALPDSLGIHGRSLLPMIDSASVWPDRKFYTHQVAREMDTIPSAVRTDRYLLTMKPNETALYNLLADPYQKKNIIDSLPELAASMQADYRKWFAEVTKNGTTPEPIQVGHTQVPEIELPAPDVFAKEAIAFKGGIGWANDWFTGVSDESKASWDLLAVDTATYAVYVEMACEAATPFNVRISLGSEVVQKEVSASLSAPQLESPDREDRGEVYERKWPLVFAGNLKVNQGSGELSVSVNGFSGSSLEIKSIRLRML